VEVELEDLDGELGRESWHVERRSSLGKTGRGRSQEPIEVSKKERTQLRPDWGQQTFQGRCTTGLIRRDTLVEPCRKVCPLEEKGEIRGKDVIDLGVMTLGCLLE
jgi:hypothetical protein